MYTEYYHCFCKFFIWLYGFILILIILLNELSWLIFFHLLQFGNPFVFCQIVHMCWSFCNDPPSLVGDIAIVVHVCILLFFMAWQQLMFFLLIMLLYNVALWWKIKANNFSSMLISLWTSSGFVSNEEKDELLKLLLMLLSWEGWQYNYYKCWSCTPCPTSALNIVLLTLTTL